MQKSSKSKLNQKLISFLLCLSSCFIVPGLTIFLGFKANMLTNNFTYLANQPLTQPLFMVWLLVSILTHAYLLYTLYKIIKIKPQLILITFITMLISALIPYEKGISLMGFLHVATAYLAFILYNLCLYKFASMTSFYVIKQLSILYSLYLVMIGICFSITMYYGSINGLVEVIFCVTTPILLYLIKRKVAEAT